MLAGPTLSIISWPPNLCIVWLVREQFGKRRLPQVTYENYSTTAPSSFVVPAVKPQMFGCEMAY